MTPRLDSGSLEFVNTTPTKLNRLELAKVVAVSDGVDVRTIVKYLRGETVRATVATRIAAALEALGHGELVRR